MRMSTITVKTVILVVKSVSKTIIYAQSVQPVATIIITPAVIIVHLILFLMISITIALSVLTIAYTVQMDQFVNTVFKSFKDLIL